MIYICMSWYTYMMMMMMMVYYTQIYIYIQSTPDKSDSQVTGKSVRLSEMSDLSEIKNIM